MPEFKIKHVTLYTYQGLVHDSANQITLYPLSDEYQEVLEHTVTITGDPFVYVYDDYYGNKVGSFTRREPHSFLEIVSDLRVSTSPKPLPFDSIFPGQQWEDLDKLKSDMSYVDYLNYESFANGDVVKQIAEENKQVTPLKSVLRLCKYVYDNFEYIPGITTVETKPDEIWTLKAGVCQDFAHILLDMLRMIAIPSRYVSGYICPNKNGMRGEGATHAWVEAYIPDYGWLGIDPTNNCIVNDTHVRLALGRNFTDCSPVKGVYKGRSEHNLEVKVTVSYQGDESFKVELPFVTVDDSVDKSVKNSYVQYREILELQQQQQQQ